MSLMLAVTVRFRCDDYAGENKKNIFMTKFRGTIITQVNTTCVFLLVDQHMLFFLRAMQRHLSLGVLNSTTEVRNISGRVMRCQKLFRHNEGKKIRTG